MRPGGAKVEVQRTKAAPPFRCETDGPGYAAARWAMEQAFGKPVGEAGSGASIRLLRTLQKASPRAEFILWGAEDMAAARIHASDESVDPAGDRAAGGGSGPATAAAQRDVDRLNPPAVLLRYAVELGTFRRTAGFGPSKSPSRVSSRCAMASSTRESWSSDAPSP